MMRALVVYESMFGNTASVARAIADGLAPHIDVELTEVAAAPAVIADDVALLVVGGPTHQFGMSRPSSRGAARKETDRPLVSASIGLREWLESVQGGSPRLAAATFTTQVAEPRWIRRVGSASRAAEARLGRLGFRIVAPAGSFYVHGMTGPLVEGELERASAWGASLAESVGRRVHAGASAVT